jgi:hypothetical protein
MRTADRILGIFLLLLSFLCLWEGIRVWDGAGGTGFMPVLVGVVFAILSLGFLILRSHQKDSPSIPWPSGGVCQQIGMIFIALASYTLLLPWVGYLIGTTLFLIGLVRVMGKVRWEYGVVFSLVVSVITYLVFKTWLNMPLPTGFLGL